MNYGFYQSAAGLISQVNRLQVTSNNLANSETVGFKADSITTAQRLPARIETGAPIDAHLMLEALGGGQLSDPTRFDLSQGSLNSTGDQLNMAIDGEAFFLVGDETGGRHDVKLTRDGRFTRDPEGDLAMAATGMKVLDASHRTIPVPLGTISVGPDGVVSHEGQELGQIAMMEVDRPDALRKLGDSLIEHTAAAGKMDISADSTLWQGYLESSTVKPVLEMAGLVQISRAIEANATLMQAQDLLVGQAINTFGKVT
ncbi:MAG: flagellar hook basal-body protein [Phycisphaerales bacterium]|nr:hypothetical protein [Phycisphaerae bacterium]MCH2151967.1 flagellar hook basal-body protein [Phycisphaerales bacterium]